MAGSSGTPPAEERVEAAGGLLLRRSRRGPVEVAMVHRPGPGYDDWTFPKGKLDPGEDHLQGALREVQEETGFACDVGNYLGSIHYYDRRNRPKQVLYWTMRPRWGIFHPNLEVDELRWLSLDGAARLLTYERDRTLIELVQGRLLYHHPALLADPSLLETMMPVPVEEPVPVYHIYLLRHAKAEEPDKWTGNDNNRPLTKAGEKQAEELAERLAGLGIERLISSPATRCLETLKPLARRTGLRLEKSPALRDHTYPTQALELIRNLHCDAVLCTHLDVVQLVLQQCLRAGVELNAEPDARRGSVWILEVMGGQVQKGTYVEATG